MSLVLSTPPTFADEENPETKGILKGFLTNLKSKIRIID